MRLIDEYYNIPEYISENKKYYLKNKIIIPLVEAQYYILTQNLKSSKEFRKFDKKLKKYKEIYNDEKISRIAIKIHRLFKGILMKQIEFVIGIKNRIRRNK